MSPWKRATCPPVLLSFCYTTTLSVAGSIKVHIISTMKADAHLAVVMVVAGDHPQGLQDEVNRRVELVLQPLHIHNPALPARPVQQQQHLLHSVDHVFSTADQSLGETRGKGIFTDTI